MLNDILSKGSKDRIINLSWKKVEYIYSDKKNDAEIIKVKIELINPRKWIHIIPVRIID